MTEALPSPPGRDDTGQEWWEDEEVARPTRNGFIWILFCNCRQVAFEGRVTVGPRNADGYKGRKP